MKTCTKCHKEKPATIEYFYNHKSGKDGLNPQCKECCRIYSIDYHWKHRKQRLTAKKRYYGTIRGHLRQVYAAIKQRCNNPNADNYPRYGGRGIKCLFTSNKFVDYVINVLQVDPRGLQIDRINNNGHYELGNIRFVTAEENCNNRRKRRY